MRTLQGRRDWRAGSRIDGLLRYALLGDSHAYGAGVAPDQTLAATFEKQVNESLPGWPVEVVNLGISGYNLWNSWLAFKQAPQVFDGIVLVLCSNDADLFGRTFNIQYSHDFQSRWDGAHPFGEAVVRCFDELAAFAQQLEIPVAVVFSSTRYHFVRITEIIAGLCASRGFCFIDTYAHYQTRNFTSADLMASRADFHPSAQAHDAIGRYLLATLKREGWFVRYGDAEVEGAPDRIVAAALSMVQTDRYPPDVALSWALRVLHAKSRLAQRLQAIGSGDSFNGAADRCRQTLVTADRRWHMAQRLRAFVEAIAAGHHSLSWVLYCSEDERLRLEEICFALLTEDWDRLSTHSFGTAPQRRPSAVGEVPATDAFLDQINQVVQSIYRELQTLRSLAVQSAIGLPHDEALMLADIELLEALTGRVQLEYEAVRSIFARITQAFNDASPLLTEAHKVHLSGMIGGALAQIKRAFELVGRWPALLEEFRDPEAASFTTVEVTLRAGPVEGKTPNCIMKLQAEYAVPFRLAFNDIAAFWADGCEFLVKLHVPVLYAGRVLLSSWEPRSLSDPMVDFKILKVEVYNREDKRRAIDPASFQRDSLGRFVSPTIYLFGNASRT